MGAASLGGNSRPLFKGFFERWSIFGPSLCKSVNPNTFEVGVDAPTRLLEEPTES